MVHASKGSKIAHSRVLLYPIGNRKMPFKSIWSGCTSSILYKYMLRTPSKWSFTRYERCFMALYNQCHCTDYPVSSRLLVFQAHTKIITISLIIIIFPMNSPSLCFVTKPIYLPITFFILFSSSIAAIQHDTYKSKRANSIQLALGAALTKNSQFDFEFVFFFRKKNVLNLLKTFCRFVCSILGYF